jgi:hypothetical protein
LGLNHLNHSGAGDGTDVPDPTMLLNHGGDWEKRAW